MRTFIEKIQNTFAAVAFAEAGEHETAMQMAHLQVARPAERLSLGKRFANMIDRNFTAITFAEAGCNDMARQYLNGIPVTVRTTGVGRSPWVNSPGQWVWTGLRFITEWRRSRFPEVEVRPAGIKTVYLIAEAWQDGVQCSDR